MSDENRKMVLTVIPLLKKSINKLISITNEYEYYFRWMALNFLKQVTSFREKIKTRHYKNKQRDFKYCRESPIMS